MDTREGIRKGGDSGHAVVPGNIKASLLIDSLRFEDLEMPPDNQLPPEIIADFVKWINMGAPDPRNGKLVVANKSGGLWSLKPISKAAVPKVKDAAWPRDDIDRFILARLEKEGLKPVGDALSVQLLRRVYLDLIGLPPSPAQIEAFVKDPSPQAYAAVVDSLLESPQFGQRWGRHWLDVVRYAESNGKDRDVLFPARLEVSRLRHRFTECRQTLRSFFERAIGGRFAFAGKLAIARAIADCHRVFGVDFKNIRRWRTF